MASPEQEQKLRETEKPAAESPEETSRELAQATEERKAATALVEAESTNKEAETKEESRARDVRELMKQYEIFFVHTMQKENQTPHSGGLHQGVDWFTQLKICLALEPIISTSTIKKGDTERNFWASVGIILNRGTVLAGGAGDIGTTKREKRERKFTSQSIPWAKEDIEGIRRAITAHDQNDYNELIVEQPRIAGFFVLTDEMGFPSREAPKVHPPFEEIFQKLKALRMPTFAIIRGQIYRIKGFDRDSGRVIKDEKPVPLQEIGQTSFELSEDQKEQIKQELRIDSPFWCESPEAMEIELRRKGQELYIELNMQTIVSHVQQKEEIEIARTASETVRRRYFIRDGVLWTEGGRKHDRGRYYPTPVSQYPRRFPFPLEERDPLDEEKINNNGEYLSVMNRGLPKLREEGKPFILNRFAFHLYGFAEEARRFGDNETAQQAEALANQVFSREQYSAVVERRLDAQGRFRITREELEGESKSHVV